jgi:hypothetical protein
MLAVICSMLAVVSSTEAACSLEDCDSDWAVAETWHGYQLRGVGGNVGGQLIFDELHGIDLGGDGGKPGRRFHLEIAEERLLDGDAAHAQGLLRRLGGQQIGQRRGRRRIGEAAKLCQIQILRRDQALQALEHRNLDRLLGGEYSIDRRAFPPRLFLGAQEHHIRRELAHHPGLAQAGCDRADGYQVILDGRGIEAKRVGAGQFQGTDLAALAFEGGYGIVGLAHALDKDRRQVVGAGGKVVQHDFPSRVRIRALLEQRLLEFLALGTDEAGRQPAFLLQLMHQGAGGHGHVAHRRDAIAFADLLQFAANIGEQIPDQTQRQGGEQQ